MEVVDLIRALKGSSVQLDLVVRSAAVSAPQTGECSVPGDPVSSLKKVLLPRCCLSRPQLAASLAELLPARPGRVLRSIRP